MQWEYPLDRINNWTWYRERIKGVCKLKWPCLEYCETNINGSQLVVRQPSWADKKKDRRGSGKKSVWEAQLAPTHRNTGNQEHCSSHSLASNAANYIRPMISTNFYKASTYSRKDTTPDHSRVKGLSKGWPRKIQQHISSWKKNLHVRHVDR